MSVVYVIDNETEYIDDWPYGQVVPTGRSWFRCSCGVRIEDEFGGPMPTSAVAEQAENHLRTDHPEVAHA